MKSITGKLYLICLFYTPCILGDLTHINGISQESLIKKIYQQENNRFGAFKDQQLLDMCAKLDTTIGDLRSRLIEAEEDKKQGKSVCVLSRTISQVIDIERLTVGILERGAKRYKKSLVDNDLIALANTELAVIKNYAFEAVK